MSLFERLFSPSFREKTRTIRLILFGVFVHLFVFAGVMDTYFSSPVLRGLPSHNANISLAKRVVVFVSDGLRAEGIFSEEHLKYTPFLNGVRNNLGAWGVAHTRVPTESRPGHVAIFAGMYEDPHAVMKGWKHNPIDFDHVFNQSKVSFLWGSPDVVPMFNKDNLNKIYTSYYEPSFEDFSGQQSTILLDDWVFGKVKEFFKLNRPELREYKSIFFLHLLGMDTAGHVYKPNSKKYFDNLAFVDQGIKNTVELMDEFFQDGQTTYIFTSDHGMTDWGSHGSGSTHETEVPFIVWGACVKDNQERQDLKQADIATIISSLIGINNPINSVGIFQDQFFDVEDWELAHILYANVLTFTEQYKVQRLQMQRNKLSFFYEELEELRELDKVLKVIHTKIKEQKYEMSISDMRTLLASLENGKFKINQYLRFPVLICLALGLAGFMLYTACIILYNPERVVNPECVEEADLKNICVKMIGGIIILVIILLCQGVELKYCAYISFPIIMTLFLMYDLNYLQYIVVLVDYVQPKDFIKFILVLIGVYFLSLTLLYREYIFYATIGVLLWMIMENMTNILNVDKVIWLAISLYLPLFYHISPTFKENNHIIALIGAAVIVYISMVFTMNGITENTNYFHLIILIIQLVCMIFSYVNIALTSYYTDLSSGVMTYIYGSSWIIFVMCLFTMTLHPRKILRRSLGIQISLYNIYFLMSFNGESLFLVLFICLCLTWSLIEMQESQSMEVSTYFRSNIRSNVAVSNDDCRKCFIFMTYLLLSFFGAGNISDLNTFDPMWTRCFVKVFNPFLITALIAFKLLIPFIITTVTFQSVNAFSKTPTVGTFSIILFYSDIMVMNMMFRVTNEGSWLDIGLSISRFVIANVITIALLVIYSLVRLLTENRLFDYLSSRFHKALGIPIEDDLLDVHDDDLLSDKRNK